MTSTPRRAFRIRWRQILPQGLYAALQPYFPDDLIESWDFARPTRQRLFPALVCVWGMVFQAIAKRDSDEAASQQLASWLEIECAPRSGAYSKAKHRLPAELVPAAARLAARRIKLRRRGLWHGRRVKVVDATCLTLWDVAANQARYPQPGTQAPGCGFPLLRLVVVMDGASGAVLDWACGSYTTGEGELLWRLLESFEPGDVVVLDRGYSSYALLAVLAARGVDVVVRQQQQRLNRRPGQRRDWVEEWSLPPQEQPVWQREPLPPSLRVRVIYHRLPSGQWLKLNTTLPARSFPAAQVAELYRGRWRIETQFRELKQGLGLDFVTARTPAMVEQVVAAHLLALNLMSALRVDVARRRGWMVWRVGLTSLVQAVEAARGLATRSVRTVRRWVLAMVTEVPEQRGREEPRVKKRRPSNYRLMTKPRALLRAQVAGGRA